MFHTEPGLLRHRLWRRVALALLWLAACGPSQATEADAVLGGIQRWLDGTRSLEGRFRQELLSGALGTGLEESGRLYLERPGRMRWDYLEPERKVALIRDGKTWLFVEEDEQLILGRLDSETSLLPVLLLGQRPLSQLFEARLESTPDENEVGAFYVTLVPLEQSERLERVVLEVRPPGFAIDAAEVVDGAGNRVRYRFFRLRRNRRIDAERFRFETPDGVEVLGRHDSP